jgi:hypothetical protein
MAVLLRPGAPAQAGGRRARRHPAPVWIRALAAVAATAVISVALALASVAGAVRDDLAELGHRIVPQVAATEDLYFTLSDMDAQLANVLLAGDDPGLAELRMHSLDTYEKDRLQATTALQQTTAVAGADADAQRLVREVLDRFGRYQSLAAQTIQLNDREGNDAGKSSADVLFLQRQATDVLHTTLGTVRALAGSKIDLLEQSSVDRMNTGARLVLVVLGCLLLALLVGLQVLLRLRMRRRLNPAVAVATILAGWLVVGGLLLLGNESSRLAGAKDDAFASLRLAWQARSVSYDANADESRYLLDPGRAKQYEDGFFAKSKSLAGVWAPTLAEYDDSLGVAVTVYNEDSRVQMRGLIARTLETLDSADERTEARSMLSAYLQYQQSDGEMRAKMAAGDLRGALELCVGTSNEHFDRYVSALDKLVDINQDAFDASIADGEDALDGWTGPIPYGAGILVVALVAVGVWPRLNEYR